MINYKKAQKKDKPLLIKYKLLTITPYLKDNNAKLKAIAWVSDFITNNYAYFTLIYSYFKIIGCYAIINGKLDTIYLTEKYRNKGIATQILKQESISQVEIKKENQKILSFFLKNHFQPIETNQDNIILRRNNENE